jgi:ribosomal protein S18 acetylase RimI-like enzyme
MEIVRFEKVMAAGVARCYSEVVAPAPYCAPVGGEWFADLKRLARQPLAEDEILVARDGGEGVAGFAHVGVAAPATEEWHVKGEPGVIRFLAYRPGQRPIGKALLEEAEEWLQQRECSDVIAGHCNFMYPFYHLPFGHVSELMGHVPPLFGMAGYSVEESEVFFAWEDFEVPEAPKPEMDVEVVVEWRDQVESFGEGVAVLPKRGGKNVGECKIVRLGSDERRPALRDWCFCTSLDVEESLQGRGLGKHLLARGLGEMRKAGPRHAMISTDWNNHRAYLFYTNFGYRFLDRTFSFRKKLGGARRGAGQTTTD